MNQRNRRSLKQREMLHWAQGGVCAGCGKSIGWVGGKIGTPGYPTFDHVDPKQLGGRRSVANGLLKHLRCNLLRDNDLPTGCDLIWHWSVLERLRSPEAIAKWGESVSPAFHEGWKPPAPSLSGQA